MYLDPDSNIGNPELSGRASGQLPEGQSDEEAVHHEVQHGKEDHQGGEAQLLAGETAVDKSGGTEGGRVVCRYITHRAACKQREWSNPLLHTA